MNTIIPGMVIGFREGLEAFLIVGIALRVLEKTGRRKESGAVWTGTLAGIAASLTAGAVLYVVTTLFNKTELVLTLWESIASLTALALVSTFIIWMIRHGSELGTAVEQNMAVGKGKIALAAASAVMVAREGVEIALFSFAGTVSVTGIAIGVFTACILTILVFTSLVKVNLAAIFNVTLVYLIIQAGFLLGIGIHEGISVAQDSGLLTSGNPLLLKPFDLTNTIFDHKQGIIGLPLMAILGWHSRPEWIQFISQYAYTAGMLLIWKYSRAGAKK